MEVVNGIPCFNCTDVDRAKKAPFQDVATSANVNDVAASTKRQFSSPNDPLSLGDRGRVVNFGT